MFAFERHRDRLSLRELEVLAYETGVIVPQNA